MRARTTTRPRTTGTVVSFQGRLFVAGPAERGTAPAKAVGKKAGTVHSATFCLWQRAGRWGRQRGCLSCQTTTDEDCATRANPAGSKKDGGALRDSSSEVMQVVRLVKLRWVDIDSNPLQRYGPRPLIHRRAEKCIVDLTAQFLTDVCSLSLSFTTPSLQPSLLRPSLFTVAHLINTTTVFSALLSCPRFLWRPISKACLSVRPVHKAFFQSTRHSLREAPRVSRS